MCEKNNNRVLTCKNSWNGHVCHHSCVKFFFASLLWCVVCKNHRPTHHDYPSTFRNAFMVTNVHEWTHDDVVVCDDAFAFIPYEFGSMSKVESFFEARMIFLALQLCFWWEWHNCDESPNFQLRLILSHTSLTCFCLCSSIISCIIHFISVCFVFWWCYLGSFPSSLDTNWSATTIDAAAVCFLFLYPFYKFCFLSLCQAWFLEIFAFETHYVKKQVLQSC